MIAISGVALSTALLLSLAANNGILIESGDTLFIQENAPNNYIRLGFSAINIDKISEGLAILGRLIKELADASHCNTEVLHKKIG